MVLDELEAADHNLNIGHEDDFNMRRLHKEFDDAGRDTDSEHQR